METPRKDLLNEFGIDEVKFLPDEFDEAIAGYIDYNDFKVAYNIDIVEAIAKKMKEAFSMADIPDSVVMFGSKIDMDYAEDCQVKDFYPSEQFENARIGQTDDGRLVYDYEKMAEILMNEFSQERERKIANGEPVEFYESEDQDYTNAVEHIEYNIIRALPYFTPSPIIIHGIEDYLDYKDEM